MTDQEITRFAVAEENIRRLEKRVIELEDQVTICLRWMRVQAELEAKKKDPDYPMHDDVKA